MTKSVQNLNSHPNLRHFTQVTGYHSKFKLFWRLDNLQRLNTTQVRYLDPHSIQLNPLPPISKLILKAKDKHLNLECYVQKT